MTFTETFPLWDKASIPFRVPEDESRKEHFQDHKGGIDRLTDVTEPSITWFPAAGNGPHPAVLVCPGGGYGILAWNHEGRDICTMLNQNGFSAFLLKYRCPDRRTAAHADAARAMRMIRANAERFGIFENKVGAIGFSAGAHLAATISAPADGVPYPPADAVDAKPFRPDFTALIYPAYLADDQLNLAPEFKIDANVPPTFLLQTENDPIRPENALAWFLALKRVNVPAELHIWPEGGHGYGALRTGEPVAEWPALAGAWFRRQAGIK